MLKFHLMLVHSILEMVILLNVVYWTFEKDVNDIDGFNLGAVSIPSNSADEIFDVCTR